MSDRFTVSLRLTKKENTLIRNFAEIKGISVSEFLRESALDEIRYQLDLLTYDEAFQKYVEEPEFMTSIELKEKLGLL
ncbi:MAG TPA: DUF6290 family protein [Erysipelothrix sp.]|nr:DUF6290 family protein [Erysipelothrix sp.]